MITKYLEIGNNDWGLLVCYNYDSYDFDDMWAIMMSFGLSDKKANKSLDILSEPNTGMSISNQDLRMSVIFIGDSTNESEWWSTLNHELTHVGVAIIDYYGESYENEPYAYLQGELMRMVVEEISEPCF